MHLYGLEIKRKKKYSRQLLRNILTKNANVPINPVDQIIDRTNIYQLHDLLVDGYICILC